MTTKKLLIAATALSALAFIAMREPGKAQDNSGKHGQDQQPPQPKTQIPSSIHIFNYGDFDKQCIAWTDGCRICSRNADRPPTCSNIGIACQPTQTITCTGQP